MDQNEKEKKFNRLVRAAESGNVRAQYSLGQAYEYGEFDDKVDLEEAMVWYKKAGEGGYAHAQFKLSIFYENGMACDTDLPAAYSWAEKAALQGLTAAQKRVSAFLTLGKGVARDLQKSGYWHKEALTLEAGQGNMAAYYHLGNFWMQGWPGWPKDPRQAISYYTKSAEGGYKDAMLRLAGIYQNGAEITRDESAAITWYERAGYGDHPAAKRLRTIVELRPRCSKGEASAQFELGKLLGVDTQEGEAFLQAAASQGHREAALFLFEFYVITNNGRSITTEQRKWIVKAAELGVPQAQLHVGWTTNNREEKLSWLRKAADQGYQPAIDELNKMKSSPEPESLSTDRDDLTAQLRKRADAGDEVAKIALKSLLSSSNSSQIKE